MVEPNLKDVVKGMCKAVAGGRSAMAGALGMSETAFNNNLYEKNGCRFFEIGELEAMEDISGTNLLTEYFARRRGLLVVEIPALDEWTRWNCSAKHPHRRTPWACGSDHSGVAC